MTTHLSSAAIPAFYRDLYHKCSNNDDPIHKDVYQTFLSLCNLDATQLKVIWDIAGPKKQTQNVVNRTNFYKTLALVAWVQQGREISEKLFENFTGNEYPAPKVNDLTPVLNIKKKLFITETPLSNSSYQKLTQTDTVKVQLAPEKKGLILKHSEYLVTSRRFSSKVMRRYNDFVALHELLLNRFPYRLVPNLPPKKIIINDNHLAQRTRGLQRWLTLVCRHPVISHDGIVTFFLTDEGSDHQHRIRNTFRKIPDEFMTSDVAANAKELLPADNTQTVSNRETLRLLVNVVGRLKQNMESLVEKTQESARDLEDMATQLKNVSCMNVDSGHQFVENWATAQRDFGIMSKDLRNISHTTLIQEDTQQKSVCETLSLLYDILVAHKDLCERLERGLANDHQVALSKMLALKKKKLQGAIRGIDPESVEQLEAKMLAQENVISSMDLRTDFSLYCVHMETQLVFAYLGTMPQIFAGFVDLKTKAHFELLDLWRNLQTQFCGHEGANKNGFAVSN
ncbi:sorting nexin-8-like isoform X2 [Anthonomus grandis grandis]|uniref:sorting nexin-8-like isoform X2 n=1 Tax=Anthonomus grandis grandis TaxID=2921223 RepID=UPI00216555D7|nr:sorting nexin-8-like isoform X2 [Anthonomus grandis grandis]XP_050297682.1 sorting nexin-8-like isoform X2 [Anthonomus grandis grandis]